MSTVEETTVCLCGCGAVIPAKTTSGRRRMWATKACGNRYRGYKGSRQARMPRLPAKPVAAYLRHLASKRRGLLPGFWFDTRADGYFDELCRRYGTTSRNVRRWESGEQELAQFETVDVILTRSRALWWDIYDPERWPDLYSPEEWQRVVERARLAFEGDDTEEMAA